MQSLKFYFLVSLLLICNPFATYAQDGNGRVQGVVYNQNGELLSDVNITVTDNGDSYGTATSDSGFFELELPAGTHSIELSYVGFETVKRTVTVYEGQVTKLSIILNSESQNLSEITVTGNPSLTQSAFANTKKLNYKIPGGVNITNLDKFNSQRSLTLKDALGAEPGVIIQEFFGSNDQPRLNIRGSGIQSNPQQRGVLLLQDGVRINQADGTYIIGLLEPQAADHIEVKRGSNALKYGSATLGGVVNMISKSGHNAEPLRLKLEGGSYNTYNGAVSTGHVFGNNDLYASLSYNQSDGFREWNSSDRLNATFNAGHKFSSDLESRLYFTFTDMAFDIPGPLNRQQMKSDATDINPGVNPPQSIGPNVVKDKPGRESRAFRIAQKTEYQINSNNSLQLSAHYQNLDDTFTYPITVGVKHSDSNGGGFDVRYSGMLGKHELNAGVFSSFGQTERRYFVNEGGQRGRQFADNSLWAANVGSYLNHRYAFTENFNSVATLQLVHSIRNNTDNLSNPDARPFYIAPKDQYGTFSAPAQSLDQSYWGFNPKIGFLYENESSFQLYGNVSRSFEPPTFDELINISGGNPNKSPEQFKAVELDAQEATTFEVGSRGSNNWFSWNISLYHSRVANELLTATELFGISGTTRNYPDRTIHQGLEAGLSFTLLRNLFTRSGDKITFDGSYTFSDFYFDEGAYEGNRIAGIPKHYINSAIEYSHPSGAFLNLNLEMVPTDTPTDHQNTLYQQSYALWGARIGIHSSNSINFFVEGNNLFDTTYASSYLIRDKVTDPPPQPLTPDEVTTFIPGSGRSLMAGFCYFIN
ncbi:TonB-dependent receptor [Aliifodinibius sp. S!AR15-10]|uniref:TonB-dependent receptor n=1 Tax=Aliifodinibius sp. S!AR15-10 TaxID=2950437 RepID=UPI0028641FAA|nr:TonB-dependent receptor [Aliifodinibius sp. S!AR15-10]MDR8390727.1 TonB-dependent receptor [Aliifodinibius sp. S!AR15-10]